jgi:hypothetical protein
MAAPVEFGNHGCSGVADYAKTKITICRSALCIQPYWKAMGWNKSAVEKHLPNQLLLKQLTKQLLLKQLPNQLLQKQLPKQLLQKQLPKQPYYNFVLP